MKKRILAILTLCYLCACKDNSKPFEVSKNGVAISFPGYISEEELADDAFIEYANRYRNFYIAGFEIPSSVSLDSARETSARRIYSSLEKYEITRSKDRDSNLRTMIKGQFKEEPEFIHYYQKILSGSDKRFLLTIWIRGDERNKKYREDIESILNSFRIQ
jgi:hypothetical protein